MGNKMTLQNKKNSFGFCMLPNKSKNVYTKVLISLKINKCNPKTIIINFEKRVEAIKEKLKCEIHNCFFHFTQSLQQHFKKLGLSALYGNYLDKKQTEYKFHIKNFIL